MFKPLRDFGSFVVCCLLLAGDAAADGPQDNVPDNVRRIPKLGIDVSDADRQELTAGLAALDELIGRLRVDLHGPDQSDRARVLLPDVLIFHRAVDQALRYQEFFDPKEIPVAKKLLALGIERTQQLLNGEAPWTMHTGLVPRGYVSKIDNTVQPYGLIIPENYDFSSSKPVRLDIWFHGRGETLSEVNFLQQRLTNKGEYTPPDTIVLHPYGRYCNANKFAGEIDTFEALADVQKKYRIDPKRIAVRGFSMGGAACWQFAVHYPGNWFAANPGAGFSETPDFLKVFQNEELKPTWWEQKLWNWYDCTGYAANLAFLPTVAYSGEIDKQKQAADMMAAAMDNEGLKLLHIIGPMTAHKIHPDSKVEIEKILSRWERLGPETDLKSPLPRDGEWETVEQFVTYTLRYNQSRCLTIDALDEHWEPARVVVQKHQNGDALRIKTQNVRQFQLVGSIPALAGHFSCEIDGQPLNQLPTATAKMQLGDRARWRFVRQGERWTAIPARDAPDRIRRKRHGLQGPIDDAFLDAFIFVKPTGKGLSEEVAKWVDAEFNHAVTHWRQQMRGDARVKLDTELTREDMQNANIVLWGDPQSNEVLGMLFEHIPVTWKIADRVVAAGDQKFDLTHHMPILIYPNPMAPNRYIVFNSSFTYREYDYLNNARQTPKLPDWAIVDVRTPPNSRWPGKIVAADFFNEEWQLKPPRAP